jgi:hypothetical protein
MKSPDGKFARRQPWKPSGFAILAVIAFGMLLQMRILHGEETGKDTPDTESLVEAIKSHSSAPKVHLPKDRHGHPFGSDFDWADYARVNQSIKYLADHAEEAWPVMVEHLGDTRYSTTIDEEDAAYVYTVGDICKKIIRDHLAKGYLLHYSEGFVSDEPYHAINAPGDLNSEALKNWCEKREDKKLYELQIEMCEWVIKKMSRLERFSEEDRQAFIEAVRQEIEELKKSQKFEPTGNFWYEDFRPFRSEKHDVLGVNPPGHKEPTCAPTGNVKKHCRILRRKARCGWPR